MTAPVRPVPCPKEHEPEVILGNFTRKVRCFECSLFVEAPRRLAFAAWAGAVAAVRRAERGEEGK